MNLAQIFHLGFECRWHGQVSIRCRKLNNHGMVFEYMEERILERIQRSTADLLDWSR